MLEQLRIRSLGVIDDATLPLSAGFTVITGETGAGKTMLLTGIGLVCGQRADALRIRHGDDRAEVEALMHLTTVPEPVARIVEEAGGQIDEGDLVLARTVAREGRSRAHVGGRIVPVTVLSDLSDHLVAIHGQADQRRLLQPALQRDMLDRFDADLITPIRERYQAVHAQVLHLHAQIAALRENADAVHREAEALRESLADIDELRPEPGEDDRLDQQISRLGHVEQLRAAAASAHALLSGDVGDDAVVAMLSNVRRQLDAVAAHDPQIAAWAATVAEAQVVLVELATDLARYVDDLDADPAALAHAQARRAALAGVLRRHGPTVDDLVAWADAARERLSLIGDLDTTLPQWQAQLQQAEQERTDVGAELLAARAAAGERLVAAVNAELAELAMGGMRVDIQVRPAAPHALGTDEVVVGLHNGTGEPIPLARGASGGELSRVMLAFEVVMASRYPVPTIVFDEVDAGVGGRAAVEVGRRLARVAQSCQVIVVTHLPQVAAFADAHVVVEPGTGADVRAAAVRRLADDDRAGEIARMLAGLGESESALAHARELLDLGGAERRA